MSKAALQPHTYRCRRAQIEGAPRRFILSCTFVSSSLRFVRSEQLDVRWVQVLSFSRLVRWVFSLCVTVSVWLEFIPHSPPTKAAVSYSTWRRRFNRKPPLLCKTPYISSTQTDHIFSPILLPGLYWRLSNQSTNTPCSCAVCICCCWWSARSE